MRISDWSSDVCSSDLGTRECVTAEFFAGRQDFPDGQGSVEWAVAWPLYGEGSTSFYCNTIPTPDGGTHEAGLRTALVKGIRGFGGLVGQKKAEGIQAKDIFSGSERSEEHTSELQSLMRISYAVFCLKKKKIKLNDTTKS